MIITIPSNLFVAVALFRAIKDIRYYLNGVYLETGPLGARLVAMDGHTMGVGRIAGSFPVASVIIPESLVRMVKSGGRNPETVDLEFDETPPWGDGTFQPRAVTLRTCDNTVSAPEVEGKFPDWRRICPSTPASGECGQFQAQHLVRCDKASQILGASMFAAIAHDGPMNSARCALGDDMFTVIMPLRNHEPDLTPPTWLQESLTPRDIEGRAS